MKMFKILASTILVIGLSAQVAHGKMSKGSMSNGNGYGLAGCGLGSMVFGQQSGPVQIVAATLNGTGVQTFGMTTGTSNCGPSVFANAETKAFIENNAVALENDIVRGQGETLATLSKMMKCEESSLSSALKSNYKTIYAPGANVSEKIMSTAAPVCTTQG